MLEHKVQPVCWIGCGDSDASSSGTEEGDGELRDVGQHLGKAYNIFVPQDPESSILEHP